jgi:hypothetical protein
VVFDTLDEVVDHPGERAPGAEYEPDGIIFSSAGGTHAGNAAAQLMGKRFGELTQSELADLPKRPGGAPGNVARVLCHLGSDRVDARAAGNHCGRSVPVRSQTRHQLGSLLEDDHWQHRGQRTSSQAVHELGTAVSGGIARQQDEIRRRSDRCVRHLSHRDGFDEDAVVRQCRGQGSVKLGVSSDQ